MRNSHASEPATVRLRRASSGGVCRREFARSNLSRLGQRTQALHLLFLLTLRLRSPLAAAALNLRGATKRPQHRLRPSAAVLYPTPEHNEATLLRPMFTPGTAFWITPFGLIRRVFQD
jgi:hypothetical protein